MERDPAALHDLSGPAAAIGAARYADCAATRAARDAPRDDAQPGERGKRQFQPIAAIDHLRTAHRNVTADLACRDHAGTRSHTACLDRTAASTRDPDSLSRRPALAVADCGAGGGPIRGG